jgi:hypothetical protein
MMNLNRYNTDAATATSAANRKRRAAEKKARLAEGPLATGSCASCDYIVVGSVSFVVGELSAHDCGEQSQ